MRDALLRCARRLLAPQDFAREERGQISFLMVFAMFALTPLVGLVLNVSNVVQEKTQLQEVADAAAYASAGAGARSLNFIANSNIAIFELTAWLVVTDSLTPSTKTAKTALNVQRPIATGLAGSVFPPTVAVGVAWTGKIIQEQAFNVALSAATKVFNATRGLSIGLRKALATIQKGIRKALPAILIGAGQLGGQAAASSAGIGPAVLLWAPLPVLKAVPMQEVHMQHFEGDSEFVQAPIIEPPDQGDINRDMLDGADERKWRDVGLRYEALYTAPGPPAGATPEEQAEALTEERERHLALLDFFESGGTSSSSSDGVDPDAIHDAFEFTTLDPDSPGFPLSPVLGGVGEFDDDLKEELRDAGFDDAALEALEIVYDEVPKTYLKEPEIDLIGDPPSDFSDFPSGGRPSEEFNSIYIPVQIALAASMTLSFAWATFAAEANTRIKKQFKGQAAGSKPKTPAPPKIHALEVNEPTRAHVDEIFRHSWLAIIERPDNLLPGVFVDGDAPMAAAAESLYFNADSWDLVTPRWEAALVPVTVLDDLMDLPGASKIVTTLGLPELLH